MALNLLHRPLTIAELFGVTPTIFISVKTTETANQLLQQTVASIPTTTAIDLTKPLILPPSIGKQVEKFFAEYWPILALAGLSTLIIYGIKEYELQSILDEE